MTPATASRAPDAPLIIGFVLFIGRAFAGINATGAIAAGMAAIAVGGAVVPW